MKLAIAQMKTRPGAHEENVKRMLEQAHAAHELGASLLVFPAPVLTGLNSDSLALSRQYLSDLSDAFQSFVHESPIPCLVPLMLHPLAIETEVFFVQDQHINPLRFTDSFNRSLVDVGDIKVKSSTRSLGFELEGCHFAVSLSADDFGLALHESDSFDVILHFDCAGYCIDDDIHPSVALRSPTQSDTLAPFAEMPSESGLIAEARRTGTWIASVEGLGGFGRQVMTGGSLIIDQWGEIAASAPSFQEALIVADIETTSELSSPHAQELKHDTLHEYLWQALQLALKDMVEGTDLQGVALILDASMRSSALLALCIDALGPTKIQLVVPPDGVEQMRDVRHDALTMAHELGLVSHDPREYLGFVGSATLSVADAQQLMEFSLGRLAQTEKLLALSSYDKTYAAISSNKMLLQAASFAPFGDVYRSDVYAMARARNAVSPIIVPQALRRLELPEELNLSSVSRSEVTQLSELDAILYLLIGRGYDAAGIAAELERDELVVSVVNRVQASELSRRTLPICPVVSDTPFTDWQWPIINSWRVHDVKSYSESLFTDLAADGGVLEHLLRSLMQGNSFEMAEEDYQWHFSEMMGFVNDYIQDGGLTTDTGDVWGMGMFSNN